MTIGIKIKRLNGVPGWKAVRSSVYEYEHQDRCPSDGTKFHVVAAITCAENDAIIRLGVCPTCSLIGYMDRPKADQIDQYYAKTWMGQTEEEAIKIARDCYDRMENRDWQTAIKEVYADIDLDPMLPVMDYGCGYGNGIAELWYMGFLDIRGVDPCPARKEACRVIWGINDQPWPERFTLIRSSHVFEHLSDPLGTLKRFAQHQEPGDRLMLWMPDFWSEPTLGVLLFWPHLWSFTHAALDRMAAHAGYRRVKEIKGSKADVCVMYERGTPSELTWPHAISSVYWKLVCGLGFRSFTEYKLDWHRDGEGCRVTQAEWAQVAQSSDVVRSMLCEDLRSPKSSAPLEIQWPGELVMFEK